MLPLAIESGTLAIIAGIIIAAIAPFGAWLIAVRKMSGRIQTSEAATLWQEATNLRTEYTKRIEVLTARVDKLNARVGELEAEKSTWVNERFTLTERLIDCERRMRERSRGEGETA